MPLGQLTFAPESGRLAPRGYCGSPPATAASPSGPSPVDPALGVGAFIPPARCVIAA